MERVVKSFAAAVAVLVALALSATAASPASGQAVPDPTIPAVDPTVPAVDPAVPAVDPAVPPPVSLPPGIPTVDPRVDPDAPVDPEAPPVAPIDDPSPQVAVAMAQLHVLDVQKALDTVQAALDTAMANEASARVRRDAVSRDRDAKRQVLTDVATNAYVNGGVDDAGMEPTMAEYLPIESARLLTDSAIDRNVERLREAEDRLQAQERSLSDAVAKSGQARAAKDAARAAADEAVLAVSNARRLTNATDVSPTVLGDAALTAEEIVGWYKALGVVGYVGRVDLATMAGFYVEEGKAEKVRGDVAFAQAVVETGAFTSPLTTHNNFAGIGACDSCPTGFDFPTPKEGVRRASTAAARLCGQGVPRHHPGQPCRRDQPR